MPAVKGLLRVNPVPMFAGVASAVLVLGTLVGQGGHAKGDSDADFGMSAMMPGMSMPGMSMGAGSDSGAMDPNMPGMDPNMPGMDPNMPGMAATPNDGSASGSTVQLRPGTAKTAAGMSVRLVKISHGRATVQMGQDTATLRQGAHKTFADGMTVQAVQVKPDRATLKVSPPQ